MATDYTNAIIGELDTMRKADIARKKVFQARISLAIKLHIYKAVAVSTLLCGGAELWAPTGSQLRQLDAFNATCLRQILGIRRGPLMIRNAELYVITHQPSMTALLSKHRLRWLGHVARKPDTSVVKQLMFATSPFIGPSRVFDRRMGQPAMSWNRMAVASLEEAAQNEGTWLAACHDKPLWRSICANVAVT